MENITDKPMMWGLDPLFHSHVKMFASMLLDMVPGAWGDGDSVYLRTFSPSVGLRPIRLVSFAGVVIFFQQHQKVKSNQTFKLTLSTIVDNLTNQPPPTVKYINSWGKQFTRYLLDDGSGTIRCMSWNDNNVQERYCKCFQLGDFVEVRGRLEWRHKTPIVIVQWQQPRLNPHAELLWWDEVKKMHENTYSSSNLFSISEKGPASAS